MISSVKATQVAVSHENTESSLLVATIYLVFLREQEAPLRISALSVTLPCHWALRSHRALSTLYPCPLAPWRLWPNFWPWNEKRFNILISKKREWVWEKTYLVLVPPFLQVLSRVFQELVLILSLVKSFKTKEKFIDWRFTLSNIYIWGFKLKILC